MWTLVEGGLWRVARSALTLAAIAVVTFVLARSVPGRVADEWLLDPTLGPETIAAMDRRAGAEPESIADWAAALWRSGLGASAVSGLPVAPLLAGRLANTLALAAPAMLLAWVVAALIVAGGGRATPSAARRAGDAVLTVLHSVPDVVFAVCLVWLALATGWFPVGGMGQADGVSETSLAIERVRHAVLPVIGLGLTLVPMVAWSIDAAVSATRESLVIAGARARGLDARAVFRHQVRMALPVLAPLMAASTASLLGAGAVFEVVFAWPGVGLLLVEAVLARDLPVVFGAVAASAVVLVVANAVADAGAYLADPRRR